MFNKQRAIDRNNIEKKLKTRIKKKKVSKHKIKDSVQKVFERNNKNKRLYNHIKHECFHCKKKLPEAEVLIDQIQKYKTSNNILQ